MNNIFNSSITAHQLYMLLIIKAPNNKSCSQKKADKGDQNFLCFSHYRSPAYDQYGLYSQFPQYCQYPRFAQHYPSILKSGVSSLSCVWHQSLFPSQKLGPQNLIQCSSLIKTFGNKLENLKFIQNHLVINMRSKMQKKTATTPITFEVHFPHAWNIWY